MLKKLNTNYSKARPRQWFPQETFLVCLGSGYKYAILRLMSQLVPLNPRPFLSSLVGRGVRIKLKWGLEYQGVLKSFDNYLNFQLIDAEEFQDDTFKGKLGEILIRCNNVLYVKEAVEAE